MSFLCRFSPPDKERPVVILTRDSSLGNLPTATVAPITSTIRGVSSEIMLGIDDGMKGPCAINFHNTVSVTQSRLSRRITHLSMERMEEICSALSFALGCG